MLTAQPPPTYQAIVNDATKILYHGSGSPRIDAEILLQHVVQKPLAWLIAYGDTLASKEHLIDFYKLVEMRLQGQPIAYLTGHKEFWSLDLAVNESVLIPRADTEVLVEQAVQRLANNTSTDVLDLGTGSGAIALAIAKERPLTSVLAVDSQEAALVVARQNAESHELNNVRFLTSHWFTEIKMQQFDVIVSNPPYIEPNDPHLSQGDLRFEPDSALVGAQDGLGDIQNIIQTAPPYLKTGGYLLIEHGYNQSEQVRDYFVGIGFDEIVNYRDLNDLPRCTAALWKK